MNSIWSSLTDDRTIRTAIRIDSDFVQRLVVEFGIQTLEDSEIVQAVAQLIARSNYALSLQDMEFFQQTPNGEHLLMASLRYIPVDVIHTDVNIDALFDFLVIHAMIDSIFYLVNEAGIVPTNNALTNRLVYCIVRSSRDIQFEKELRDAKICEAIAFIVQTGHQLNWVDLLLIATAYKSVPVVELISSHITPGVNDIHVPDCMFNAVRRCDVIELKALVAIGVAVNRDTPRETSLMHIALDRNLWGYGESSPGAIVDILIEAGADWEKCDERGNSPLHIAAHYGFQSVCKILKRARLRYPSVESISLFVNRVNDENKTALDTVHISRQRGLPRNDHKFLVNCILFVRGCQILMACGATVSRKVVIILQLIQQNTPMNKAFQSAVTQAISIHASIAMIPTELMVEIISDAYNHTGWVQMLDS